ncbi:unnamed protein product [Cylicocyclus nassatus]|uniref:Uncharacterized protein n=1 Tax=Cylicocyclus nassatus TaxID=53992 RepID=A0AA36DN85_CYLNA|nr:unnamed protein product [Cylicocyclus nassatus]
MVEIDVNKENEEESDFCDPEDYVDDITDEDRNERLILGLIWTIILRFRTDTIVIERLLTLKMLTRLVQMRNLSSPMCPCIITTLRNRRPNSLELVVLLIDAMEEDYEHIASDLLKWFRETIKILENRRAG